MNYSEIAKKLGRRGGLRRAQILSKNRKREIATIGAKARIESIELAKVIQSNFMYVEFIRQLAPPPKVISQRTCSGKLPGIYES